MTPSPSKAAGVLVPVFAIRRRYDLGIGDTSGVQQFIDWAAETQIGVLQFLPITETGADNSPYNAISAVALDPLTLDLSPGALPDLTEEAFSEVIVGENLLELRSGSVRYERVRRLKLSLLDRAFRHFQEKHLGQESDRGQSFALFQKEEQAWLADYCLFRCLMEREEGSAAWDQWPEEYGTIARAREFVADRQELRARLDFFAYVQWVASRQWRAVRRYAEQAGVRLMGDVPFGVSYYSADVFAQPELFDLEWSGGAPPEAYFKEDRFTQKWGQNWGIPLYRWEVMEDQGFAWWRRRIGKLTDIFDIFRIDHALGFYRIYRFPWRPERNEHFLDLSWEEAATENGGRVPGFWPQADDSQERCAANRSQGERFLRVIQEAAGQAEIVAEDLGMVPPYVRPSLETLGIPGMKIPQWEYGEEGQVCPGQDYPEISFTTYATHDHPPLKAIWENHRKQILDEEEGAEDSARELHALARFAGCEWQGDIVPRFDEEVRQQLIRGLFASNARYAVIMMTDFLSSTDRFNVPGMSADENWSTRLRPTVRDFLRNPHWTNMGASLRRLVEETGRGLPQCKS
ncbi:MAG: 4-alpha-glucanotransferase [Verrucomicrobiota bacterium]